MSKERYNFQEAVSQILDALQPLEALATLVESIERMEVSNGLKADLMAIEAWYPQDERLRVIEQIDEAWKKKDEAVETVKHQAASGIEHEAFDGYAKEHGEDAANKAFQKTYDAMRRSIAADDEICAIRNAHPAIYRVHAHVKNRS